MPTFNRSKKKNKSSIKRSKQKGGNCKVNGNIIDSLQTLLFIPFHKYIKYPMPCLGDPQSYNYTTIFDTEDTTLTGVTGGGKLKKPKKRTSPYTPKSSKINDEDKSALLLLRRNPRRGGARQLREAVAPSPPRIS